MQERAYHKQLRGKVIHDCVITTKRVIIKKKHPKRVCKKRSLLRTLQTLGSAPNWTDGSPRGASDSDAEEAPPSAKRRKKKRSKKRKRARASGNEEDETGKPKGEKEDPGTTVTKKKKPKEARPKGKPKPVKNGQRNDSQPEKEGGDRKELTRQQWRNKTKMKRKCKNKYQPDGAATGRPPKAEAGAEPQAEPQASSPVPSGREVPARTLKGGNKAQKEDGGRARRRKEEEDRSSLYVDAQPPANKKDPTNQKPELGGKSQGLAGPGGEHQREKGSELAVHRKPRQSKERHILAEKLRRMLHAGDHEGPPEEEEEEEEEEKKTGAEEGVPDRSAALRSKMEQRLESARFRYINEQLYTSTSGEARRFFRQDPQASGIYHRGYTAQVQRWPANPVDTIIAYIKHRPASLVVADFGCGDCKIARSVKNKVHSFDLAPVCDLVTTCDMADVPLHDATVDIAVFCLSLMGTNLGDFLMEANRVLVMGGVLKIAEVASRFENVRSFTSALSGLGFKLVSKDTENSHFFSFEFVKTGAAPESCRRGGLELRPCLYKKR
ncbi:hypothetical protein AAFF_G00079130 [Aldrovandia affinis]|uniref:Ribosomal RNA-processing protein 8 n=1 Tax=Aldrovandia affinis TaxID=143900 RepID=A0AAD7RXM6_9TELE|nr:hypothetical protein AAFF_G00079130 [Aldrovandia affinis]